MDAIKYALQEQLEETIERLKGLGGAVVFEDYPGAPEDDGQGDAGSDGASIGGERELAFEVRGRLVERANRLAEALDRLRFGEYGTCQICGESIAAGRLRAIPEVTTCVACQDAQERRARVSPERVGAR
ncbi:MAG TPA: TraR/DksA C4-type zinc finger protein [Candidatus Dormibacteraeota bacterium]|nr:TraR/DksA C4-type zinc finger protein [Candidatus Dormibacteraeota bacterium]